MMLPRDDSDVGGVSMKQIRDYELVTKELLEYKSIKEMAEKMADIDEENEKKDYTFFPWGIGAIMKTDTVEEKQAQRGLKRNVTLLILFLRLRKG